MSENYITISDKNTDLLLACADGTAALLYLHIRRHGSFCAAEAAAELRCTQAEIARAAKTLERLGLLDAAPADKARPLAKPLPENRLPEYQAKDITVRTQSDGAFSGIVAEAENTLGRVLNSNDLKILFGIYDHLGLPADVIMLLLHHCVDEYQHRNGAGRLPTMRYIEKEAWYWADMEILTLDSAEEHIRRRRERQELAAQVMDLLQIRGREATASEKKYIDAWLSMGYLPETIAIAYDRTVVSTGKLTWKYMDKIICSWAEKKLFTPAEIEAGDARRSTVKKTAPSGAATQEQEQQDLAYLQKMYGQGKGGAPNGT